jgi:AraC-like DNA-binding protein
MDDRSHAATVAPGFSGEHGRRGRTGYRRRPSPAAPAGQADDGQIRAAIMGREAMDAPIDFFKLDGPLVPSPSDLQTRAAHLQGFVGIVRGLGRNPDRILERYEIDPRALTDPDAYVDCASLIGLIDECSYQLDQPAFGVSLARRQCSHVLGVLAPLCRSAPDVRTALEDLCRYMPVVHSPQCDLELVEGETGCELRLGSRSESAPLDQMIYGAMFTVLGFLGELSDGDFTPRHVATKRRPSARCLQGLEGALGGAVQTNAERDAIGFSKELLARPLRSASRLTYRLLSDYLTRVETIQRKTVIQRVEDYIRGSLGEGCTLSRCAAALGMSARALQLRLEDEGLSFSDLLCRQRISAARSLLLASDDLTIDEVAIRLGYAEQTSFGRAFKRWTGCTPGEFRSRAAEACG